MGSFQIKTSSQSTLSFEDWIAFLGGRCQQYWQHLVKGYKRSVMVIRWNGEEGLEGLNCVVPGFKDEKGSGKTRGDWGR